MVARGFESDDTNSMCVKDPKCVRVRLPNPSHCSPHQRFPVVRLGLCRLLAHMTSQPLRDWFRLTVGFVNLNSGHLAVRFPYRFQPTIRHVNDVCQICPTKFVPSRLQV